MIVVLIKTKGENPPQTCLLTEARTYPNQKDALSSSSVTGSTVGKGRQRKKPRSNCRILRCPAACWNLVSSRHPALPSFPLDSYKSWVFSLCSINLVFFISNHLTFLCPLAVLFSRLMTALQISEDSYCVSLTFCFSDTSRPWVVRVLLMTQPRALALTITSLLVFVSVTVGTSLPGTVWSPQNRVGLSPSQGWIQFMQLKPTLIFY